MSVFCKELKQNFDSKAEMFAALKESKEHIIGLKKAALKDTDPVMLNVRDKQAEKALTDPVPVDVGSVIFPVINSCNWLDSHGDVHIKGLWDVSLKDQSGKVYYIINHDLEIGSVIAYPKNVEAYVQDIAWRDMGVDVDGETQVLLYKVTLTSAANRDFLEAVKAGAPIQNSVRMRYIGMTLCINDSSDDFKQEKANYDKYIQVIANRKEAEEQGYFWAITEAAVYKEGSAVLYGSNEATPILYSDPQSSSQSSNKQDPPLEQSKQEVEKSNYYNLIHKTKWT